MDVSFGRNSSTEIKCGMFCDVNDCEYIYGVCSNTPYLLLCFPSLRILNLSSNQCYIFRISITSLKLVILNFQLSYIVIVFFDLVSLL